MKVYTDPRTGIKYMTRYVGGKRQRVSLHTRDFSVAYAKATQIIGNKNPDAAKFPNCRFIDLVERYKAEVLAARAPSNYKRFMAAIHRLEQFGLPNMITDVTPSFLQQFQNYLKSISKSGKAGGINRNVRSIRTLMRQAEAWDLIAEQKWQNIKKLREPKGRIEFHTPQEIAKILDNCPNDAWRLVVLLGARAGLRRGEIAALKWQDVDFANKQLYIAPNKTDKYRYVPISADLEEALKNAVRLPQNPYVVHVGDEKNRHGSYYITAPYAKNMRDLPFHCFLHKLRHTFASHLVQAGVDLYRVSKLLGHSSIKMTEIYAHLAPADLIDAVGKLPSIPSETKLSQQNSQHTV